MARKFINTFTTPMPNVRDQKATSEWLDEPGLSAREWAARRSSAVNAQDAACVCHQNGVSCGIHR